MSLSQSLVALTVVTVTILILWYLDKEIKGLRHEIIGVHQGIQRIVSMFTQAQAEAQSRIQSQSQSQPQSQNMNIPPQYKPKDTLKQRPQGPNHVQKLPHPVTQTPRPSPSPSPSEPHSPIHSKTVSEHVSEIEKREPQAQGQSQAPENEKVENNVKSEKQEEIVHISPGVEEIIETTISEKKQPDSVDLKAQQLLSEGPKKKRAYTRKKEAPVLA